MSRVSSQQQDLTQQTDDVLREELDDKNRRQIELVNCLIAKQYQLQDAMFLNEINEMTMSLAEKIELIKKVIYLITVEKPDVSTSVIKIYNHINDMVHIYEVNCWKHTWELLQVVKRKEVPHIMVKSKHIKTKPY